MFDRQPWAPERVDWVMKLIIKGDKDFVSSVEVLAAIDDALAPNGWGDQVASLEPQSEENARKFLAALRQSILQGEAVASDAQARLRAAAGESCPRSGYWFTPAAANSRRRFNQGDVMPDMNSAYGATIWQYDDNQQS
jgi:hypothetical protein